MKTYIAVGYPDEENAYHGGHTRREEIEIKAASKDEAERIARQKMPYFHEIGVFEK